MTNKFYKEENSTKISTIQITNTFTSDIMTPFICTSNAYKICSDCNAIVYDKTTKACQMGKTSGGSFNKGKANLLMENEAHFILEA